MSAKKFNTPFAILGDKVEVPTTAQIDGSVSFEQGYPFGYEADYTDPNSKDISRSKTNQLLFDITNAIREIQQGGVSEWSEEGKPYKINSLVYAPDGTIKQSTIANNNNATTHSSWSNLVNAETLATILANEQNVKLYGNQIIDDVKTFLKSPIVPTPTTNFQATAARSTSITVNVGAGQTYTTINQALEYLSGFYPLYKKSRITATINLKAGFVMNEQVLVSGLNLGWIKIVGEDAETIITHTALTTAFNGTNYPAFGVDKGGVSPVIGQLFRFNVEKAGGNKHGIMTFGAGSSADVLSGKGFIGAGTNGIFAAAVSIINAQGANASNAGSAGFSAAAVSIINAQGANASNAGSAGFSAAAGSIINAQGANASNAGTYGIYAAGSIINAQGANASNAGTYGIYAAVSTINAQGANASNAGTYGIYATGSTINVYQAIIQNQTTGISRIRVTDGSHIEASSINTTGGTVPALSQKANTLTGNGIIYQ